MSGWPATADALARLWAAHEAGSLTREEHDIVARIVVAGWNAEERARRKA